MAGNGCTIDCLLPPKGLLLQGAGEYKETTSGADPMAVGSQTDPPNPRPVRGFDVIGFLNCCNGATVVSKTRLLVTEGDITFEMGMPKLVHGTFDAMFPTAGNQSSMDYMLPNPVACPADQWLVGLDVVAGGYFDRIRLRCAPLEVTVVGSDYVVTRGNVMSTTHLPLNTSWPGATDTIECDGDQIVGRVFVRGDGRHTAFGIHCYDPVLDQ